MAAVTHETLRQCILEAYPTAQVYMFQEVGSGGPYSVYGQSAQTVAFQNRLKELRIDAVISGNCGCGLCTTKESGSAIAAEYLGIPAVTVGAPTFIAQIHSTGVNRGVPVLRTAEYPGAFATHTEEELQSNTREIVWPQVVQALTQPIEQAEADLYAAAGKRPWDEVVYTGTFEEIQKFFQVNNWTDGLPVVPPTDALVSEYLRYTPYQPDETLGIYALAYRECQVYTAVVNAVMAGVPKELTPICLALAQALGDGEWRRPLASTHGWSPYAWLNGPLARQLCIDDGQGMISEQKNKALGRFLDLAMLNLGGYYVKENRMGTFGYLTPFTFAEDEEACLRVGWAPYHVTQGYRLNDNTVTASSALSWGNNVTPATDQPQQVMQLLAFDITEKQQNGLGNTNPQVYRTVLLTEPAAGLLAERYATKDSLEDALIETARRPLFMRAYANYWANTGSAQSAEYTFEEYYDKLLHDPQEQAALTATPAWLRGVTDRAEIETIATMQKGQTPMLIAGDAARNKFMVLPGGGYVTIEIRLPADWDALIAPMGYEPLSHFELSDSAIAAGIEVPDENGGQGPAASFDADGTGVRAPEGLTDGSYHLVPSMEQMTRAGCLYRSSTGAASAWAYGADSYATLPMTEEFTDLMKGLFSGCSLTVHNGGITDITLRPLSATQKSGGSATGLTAELLEKLHVSVGVVTRQSRDTGKKTEDGASLIVSTRLTSFDLDLDGGELVLERGSGARLLTLEDHHATLLPRAEAGATAKVGVRNSDGTWRTLTFTKQDQRTVVIQYRERDSLSVRGR